MTKHRHYFVTGASGKIATCTGCGAWKHVNVKPEDVIVGVPVIQDRWEMCQTARQQHAILHKAQEQYRAALDVVSNAAERLQAAAPNCKELKRLVERAQDIRFTLNAKDAWTFALEVDRGFEAAWQEMTLYENPD